MDTSPDFVARAATFHAGLTPDERWRIASAMFETAKAIIESSLPPELTAPERAMAVARRLHGDELSEAALQAVAVAHSR